MPLKKGKSQATVGYNIKEMGAFRFVPLKGKYGFR